MAIGDPAPGAKDIALSVTSTPPTNALPAYEKGAYAVTTDTVAAAVNAVSTTLAALDMADLQSIAIQITAASAWTGTLQFEVSNDGTNWSARTLIKSADGSLNTSITGSAATGVQGSWQGDIGGRYFRVRQSAWTAGQLLVTADASALSTATIAQQAVAILGSLPSGSNTIGSVKLTDGFYTANLKTGGATSVAGDTSIIVQQSPNVVAQGAAFGYTSPATNDARNLKASGGSLVELSLFNPTAAAVYFKLYNKASAPTVGTDVPFHTIPVAAGAHVVIEFGPYGKRFPSGIAYALTGAAGDADASAPGVGFKASGTFL